MPLERSQAAGDRVFQASSEGMEFPICSVLAYLRIAESLLRLYIEMGEQKTIRASLQDMRIRAKKSVLAHLLLDNAYDSNLLADISKCDYLEGHEGRTHLRPLEGLPPFVDDVFVYGYLREKDLFGRICNNATGILQKVSAAAREAYENTNLYAKIQNTVRIESYGNIVQTVVEIETRLLGRTRQTWLDLYQEEIAGIFVAKVDTSELSIEEVDDGIEDFARFLAVHGYGIYCVDYTQDFSGTLDRDKLVRHLLQKGFEEQGQHGEREGTILDNTSSVGNHVCSWVQDGVRTKIYNKIVSNFEAGEVQKSLGSKLAEYVDCPNEHLRKTFQHPDVQRRGCTRIEVSVYGRDFSMENTDRIEDTLQSLGKIFVVQPPYRLWENLSKHLDRCLVVACKENREIFLAWYCHTKTGRIAGVRVYGNPEKWEQSVLWAMAEFGFRRCPIFRIDVASLDPIEILPLRCYTKDAPTILVYSSMPTKLHKDAPEIEEYLPSTEYIEWQWRTRKVQTIGVAKSPWELLEVPSNREISFLSKRNRQKRLEDVADALEGDKWVEATKDFRAKLEERQEENKRRRLEDQKVVERAIARRKRLASEVHHRYRIAFDILCENTPDRLEYLRGKYRILGYAIPRDIHPNWRSRGHRVLLYENDSPVEQWAMEEKPKYCVVWATEELLGVAECGKYKKYERLQVAIPDEEIVVRVSNGRVQKAYKPTTDSFGELEKYEALRMELCRISREREVGWVLEPPPSKERVQTLRMPEGEYQCWRYAEIEYRGKPRTILFLEEKCDGCASGECQEAHSSTPVWGHFLQQEVEKIDLLAPRTTPLYCKIGRERTTKSNKKDRIVRLV